MQDNDAMLRVAIPKMYQLKEIMSFSGLAESSDSLELPARRYDMIIVAVDYTVTDAGIEAGENIAGLIKKLTIGEGSNTPIHVEKDEIGDVVALCWEDDTTGRLWDPLPTTATKQHAYFAFKGPFQLGLMARPELYLNLAAVTAEFAGATAFNAEVRVLLLEADDQTGPGYYIEREYRASDTRHEVQLGPSFVEDVLIVESGNSVLDEISVAVQGSAPALNLDHAELLNANWKRVIHSTSADGRFFIENLDLKNSAGRRLIIDNFSPSAVRVYARNIVQG